MGVLMNVFICVFMGVYMVCVFTPYARVNAVHISFS